MGLSNAEIGRALGATEKAIKERLSGLYRRVGVPCRAGLAVWAIRRGVVRFEESK